MAQALLICNWGFDAVPGWISRSGSSEKPEHPDLPTHVLSFSTHDFFHSQLGSMWKISDPEPLKQMKSREVVSGAHHSFPTDREKRAFLILFSAFTSLWKLQVLVFSAEDHFQASNAHHTKDESRT